jgi:hypothetical protein
MLFPHCRVRCLRDATARLLSRASARAFSPTEGGTVRVDIASHEPTLPRRRPGMRRRLAREPADLHRRPRPCVPITQILAYR